MPPKIVYIDTTTRWYDHEVIFTTNQEQETSKLNQTLATSEPSTSEHSHDHGHDHGHDHHHGNHKRTTTTESLARTTEVTEHGRGPNSNGSSNVNNTLGGKIEQKKLYILKYYQHVPQCQ